MNIDLDTYIISDTHFGHENIIHYCNRPEDHDFLMELYWKSIVQDDDTILHLGDLFFKKNVIDLSSLPGNKYLIKGNHDHQKDEWYESIGFKVINERPQITVNRQVIVFTHYPIPYEDKSYWDINIHGHIHNHNYESKKWSDKLYINVSVEVMDYAPVKLGEILNGII